MIVTNIKRRKVDTYGVSNQDRVTCLLGIPGNGGRWCRNELIGYYLIKPFPEWAETLLGSVVSTMFLARTDDIDLLPTFSS
jgi:hypothetical protein